MSHQCQYPQYKKSIVNLMSSVLNYYEVDSSYPSIKVIDDELKKGYKHVALLIFDGLGTSAIKHHLDEHSILRKNMRTSIQSVYPPTTTAAMTSYYTGLSPAEHGWLGWSMYFKEYGAMVDLFTNCNSYTGLLMQTKRIAYRELPYKSVYEKIKDVNGNVIDIHTIKPEAIFFPSNGNRHHPVRDMKHFRKVMKRISNNEKRTFTSAYWPNPDMLMHEFGPYHDKVKENIIMINGFVDELVSGLSDTLLIISADHGLTDIEVEYDLSQDVELHEMLIIPPSIEGRATSFFVKKEKMQAFKDIFCRKYGHDFELYTHDEVISNELFGKGEYHQRFDDFVGDFMACAKGHGILYYKTVGGKEGHHFKGHHAGLTDEEMLIPLIMIDTNEYTRS